MQSIFAKQALEEYNGEIAGFHGGINGRPFWNVHSSQFTYNPKLRFPIIPGAESYVFTATDSDGKTYSFKSENSTTLLTEIWKDLPTGVITLKVEAFDKNEKFMCISGMRTFFKCDPFPGRENLLPKAYSYRECALKAYRFAYNDKSIQYLLKNGKPDPEYNLNVFPSKMLSSIINAMITYAKMESENAANALEIAKKAADYLLALSYGEESPLAGLPYTYSIDHYEEGQEIPVKVALDRLGNVMMLYPCMVAEAYFNLADATGDTKYSDAAIKIAEFYRDNVQPNGSWYLYISSKDGTPQAENYCVPDKMINLMTVMYKRTGDKVWKDLEEGCYRYIEKNCIDGYNWEGQFEDTAIRSNYENLTHFTALSAIRHIAANKADDPQAVETAINLMRFVEDQFVVWGKYAPWCRNTEYNEFWESPAGLEQYQWYVPVDGSTAAIASAFLAVYELTGDKLWYEKACALADMITRMQNEQTGLIPTQWITENPETNIWNFWINCHLGTARSMYRLWEATGE